MPNTSHAPGLLGANLSTGDGKHLYHAEKPTVIAHTAGQEEAYRADGYQDEYIHQEFPKVIHANAADAEAEAKLEADGYKPNDPDAKAFPKVLSKTLPKPELTPMVALTRDQFLADQKESAAKGKP